MIHFHALTSHPQNYLFPGTGREITKCHGKGREGKFEACIPGNHGNREFPLTPSREDLKNVEHSDVFSDALYRKDHNDNQFHVNVNVMVNHGESISTMDSNGILLALTKSA